MEPEQEPEPAPEPAGVHYAMQRVLGPAMGVVVFVVALVVIPRMIAGHPPPFSAPQLALLFALSSLGFWWWAKRLDRRNDAP